ncbi:E3 ubiquitin-protein ligase TRIM33-like isoform X2 [Tubulanus polymorphus]|uniref:E3 ubiquitin-protein ligase TRIM33-like isoform X2 n=1 Tax=Tubulanus polymorphus TaxID=672921 RepID=UPI003DA23CB5
MEAQTTAASPVVEPETSAAGTSGSGCAVEAQTTTSKSTEEVDDGTHGTGSLEAQTTATGTSVEAQTTATSGKSVEAQTTATSGTNVEATSRGTGVEAQTTATGGTSSLNFNVCSLCKENFTSSKQPKLLPCLHSFCKNCLFEFNAERRQQQQQQQGVDDRSRCATCNALYHTSQIIDNKFISETSVTEMQNAAEESNNCTGCEDSIPATSYCIDCPEWLCDQCVQAHRRVRVTKDHTIQPKDNIPSDSHRQSVGPGDRAMYCPTHKHEPLKLYCETCGQLTCRDCQLSSNHKEHRYQFVDEVSDKHKDELRALLLKIREKRTYIDNAKYLIEKRFKDIRDKEQIVGNEIKVFAIKFIAEINNRGKELLAELNAISQAKKTQLTQKSKEIEALYSLLDHSVQFTEKALETGSNTALLLSKSLVTKQLERVMHTKCEVPNPNHNVDIRFTFDSAFVKNHIPRLGQLYVDGFSYHNNTLQGLSPSAMASFQSMTTEQKQMLVNKLLRQKKASEMASQQSTGMKHVSSSNGRPNTISYHPTHQGQGRPVISLNQLAQGRSGHNLSRAMLSRSLLQQGLPQSVIDVNAQNQLSSVTSSSASCKAVAGSDSSDSALNFSGQQYPSSTSSPQFQVKKEPVEMPSCSSVVSGAFKVKSEPKDDEESTTRSSPTQSQPNTDTNTQPFNLNEPITDQVMVSQTMIPSNDDLSEDYCACCHNGGDLLCCDNCPKVFHLQCHVPALNTAPVGAWRCGLCVDGSDAILDAPEQKLDGPHSLKRKAPSGLTDREIKVCERILLELFCHDASPPFHEPVPKSVPNYYKVIVNPVDFGLIKRKVSRQHFNHYNSMDDFIDDVRLVFTNCARFNSEHSEVGKIGKIVENFFEERLKHFMPWYVYERESVTPGSYHSDSEITRRLSAQHKRVKRPEETIARPASDSSPVS